jgi:hypothetical protein
MRNRSRTTLHEQTVTLAGFGHAAAPARRGYFVSVFVYRIADGWVICLGGGPEPFDAESAQAALGSLVPGRDFAPFAQHLIQEHKPLAELAQRLERSLAETLPGIRFEWHEPLRAGGGNA